MELYKIRGTQVISPYPIKLTPGETRLIFKLQKFFNPSHILADCYFPSPNAHGTDMLQIDAIALNQQGIFVFESKDYRGWIYGNGNHRYWTQVLNHGREKHQFYNPIRQNSTHIQALTAFLPSTVNIFSIIVFSTEATLKDISHIPDSCQVCTQPSVLAICQSCTSSRLLQPQEIDNLATLLNRSRVSPDPILRNSHITEIQENLQKSSKYVML